MKCRFYQYLWYLTYINGSYTLEYNNYNPYYEISSIGINCANNNYGVNLYSLGLYYFDFDKNLLDYYIKLLSKVRYELLINRLFLSVDIDDYIISKWLYKKRYIVDDIYIFKSCLSEYFKNHIIYYNNYKIIVFLDYEKNEVVDNITKRINKEFLPIGFNCTYIYHHFAMLNIKELSDLESWAIL